MWVKLRVYLNNISDFCIVQLKNGYVCCDIKYSHDCTNIDRFIIVIIIIIGVLIPVSILCSFNSVTLPQWS